jgi:hypothetical protein
MITKAQKHAYRVRYVKVLENLTEIHNMQPRERYIYRLMNTVIFNDFETAIDVVIEDFKEAHNDNQCQDK